MDYMTIGEAFEDMYFTMEGDVTPDNDDDLDTTEDIDLEEETDVDDADDIAEYEEELRRQLDREIAAELRRI